MANEMLILQTILCYSTVTLAAVYNYNETSDTIYYYSYTDVISGFRDIMNKDFVIGGLFPVYDCTDSLGGDLEMLEAMLFALDRINNDMNLLPNLTIGYDVRETCNSTIYGLEEAIHILRLAGDDYSILGIVGPASTSITPAVAAGLEQLQTPLIGYGSTSATLSNKHLYKYLLRTIPSTNLQAYAMVDLVSHFGWEYVSVIFNDDEYGAPGSNAFIDRAMEQSVCINIEIEISLKASGVNFNKFIKKSVRTLLNSKASVVVLFTDESTVLALFEELTKTNSTCEFVWIASDRWANLSLVCDSFPEIARGTFGFLPQHTECVKEFDNYFSQLNNFTNVRDPFFNDYIFYNKYCVRESEHGYDYGSGSGYYYMYAYEDYYRCPNDLTDDPSYSQNEYVPFVIDAVYAFAHAIQNFLDNNCDSPLRWNHTARQCDGMKYELNDKNLLEYLFNVTFNGIQNRIVSFDENGDPSGVYEIIYLQTNNARQYEYVSLGLWNLAYAENALALNNTDRIEKIIQHVLSRVSNVIFVALPIQTVHHVLNVSLVLAQHIP